MDKTNVVTVGGLPSVRPATRTEVMRAKSPSAVQASTAKAREKGINRDII
ncbi:MAG: hypothetical protein WAW36_01090 [Methylovulum miyakonense]